jgi:UPF0271 protein
MNRTVDLNADLGEGMPWDFELLARVTSANVSCGAHAGDPCQIRSTLSEAKRRNVVVGAHPSWPDREGFGRTERTATRREVESLVLDQVAALRSMATPLGVAIRYIKPHGSLYNQAMQSEQSSASIATGLIAAARKLSLPLMGLPKTAIERMAAGLAVRYVYEGFPDRRYDANLRLIPRSEANAMITDRDEAVGQAVRLVRSGIDSLCVHGDRSDSIALADAILSAFKLLGIRVRSFLQVV